MTHLDPDTMGHLHHPKEGWSLLSLVKGREGKYVARYVRDDQMVAWAGWGSTPHAALRDAIDYVLADKGVTHGKI